MTSDFKLQREKKGIDVTWFIRLQTHFCKCKVDLGKDY